MVLLGTAPTRDPVEERLFFEPAVAPRCPDVDAGERARCLLALRYEKDPAARALALSLFDSQHSLAGVTPEQDFDGSYRGVIHVVPDLPVGAKRPYLEWVAQALGELEALLGPLEKGPRFYRWRGLSIGFFRSVNRRTPAAWAHGWSVEFNTAGTLNQSEEAVRELLVHEIFHLNDQAHDDWSHRALAKLYEGLVARCGTTKACLEPWAPMETSTKGTYYAFVPENGVGEYAAELAARYVREQRTVSRGRKVAAPFKCRTPENAMAWGLLKAEFFANVDLVPECP
jgi:hypothetical protein